MKRRRLRISLGIGAIFGRSDDRAAEGPNRAANHSARRSCHRADGCAPWPPTGDRPAPTSNRGSGLTVGLAPGNECCNDQDGTAVVMCR